MAGNIGGIYIWRIGRKMVFGGLAIKSPVMTISNPGLGESLTTGLNNLFYLEKFILVLKFTSHAYKYLIWWVFILAFFV